MDRLDELTVFLAIFEAGGLVSASRRLRRSPPAVTRALAGRTGAFLIGRL
jgi:DNA-binding transcriptional LysR family regulator